MSDARLVVPGAPHPGQAGGPTRIAVLTSGGDASGMNAAVRAVVRTACHHQLDVHAVHEGYRGLVAGGDQIRRIVSEDVGGIIQRGGSVIGSARSDEFLTRAGRRQAAQNLAVRGIDGLVVIGGDGSLTGAALFRREWPELLEELVDGGVIDAGLAARHPTLYLAGLVGSIDNDMFGTDMTIGADTALHRITDAVDAIRSTAASHQRSFVVEVMGRNCGYLALMASLATGANWMFIPESPPEPDGWPEAMCAALDAGRRMGRRQNIVIVAEGAQDRDGNPITSEQVRAVLESRLGEDTRVTILGHVQRGGAPSAFDRNLGTMLGHAAVELLLAAGPDDEPQLVGIRENQIVGSPLVECVDRTREVAELIAAKRHDAAMALRGGSFRTSLETLHTLTRSRPHEPSPDDPTLTLAILHGGGPAPGMNTAARAAVRLALDEGHRVIGVRNGFAGLRDGAVHELDWMSVTEWTSRGGAELGISRYIPDDDGRARIAETLRHQPIDGILMIGGWHGYRGALELHLHRNDVPEFDLPIACMPATINNDLPGSEISVGADTALNSIVTDVDKIKRSAVAAGRCFVVEVMGRECGYLALLGGIATGAERVYLPEHGISLDDLRADVARLAAGFEQGKRLGLVIRGEGADAVYTTGFIHALFAKEGRGLFDVREAILGHVQQGGDPSPFDRIHATRLAARCVSFLTSQAGSERPESAFIGLRGGELRFTPLADLEALRDPSARRPAEQQWLGLEHVAAVMSGRAGWPIENL